MWTVKTSRTDGEINEIPAVPRTQQQNNELESREQRAELGVAVTLRGQGHFSKVSEIHPSWELAKHTPKLIQLRGLDPVHFLCHLKN